MRCVPIDGHASHLVTATLRCLGLTVRPGGIVALLRTSPGEHASVIFHQADDGAPVPPDAAGTEVVADWPGAGWTDPVRVLAVPDPSPPHEWPVNAALRAIGVRRGDSPDETTAVGLSTVLAH